MISKIELNDIATFQGQHIIDGLKKINYVFGANGTGKTSISRVINSPDNYSGKLIWENQKVLEAYVYNRDFIDLNFNKQKLKGVFTLGEAAQEITDKIRTTKEDIDNIQNDTDKLKTELQGTDGNGGKKAELAQLMNEYKDKFFTMKQKYSDTLSGTKSGEGMRGFIAKKDDFMNKVLEESVHNTATLEKLTALEEKSKVIFSNTISKVDILQEISVDPVLRHENNPILQKRIIGKNDVDISAMIARLNNSDWVHQGVHFYNQNDGICPFCQQKTSENLRNSLSEYFDQTFIQDINSIKVLIDTYSLDANRLQIQIQSLIDSRSKFIDIEQLKIENQLLDSIITINRHRMIEKQKETSKIITLDSIENICSNILTIVANANYKINENNHVVANLQKERENLTNQIWKFVVSELDTDINEYNKKKYNIDKAIQNINHKINLNIAEKKVKESELQELEKQITSIIPTRDAINRLLKSFGFNSFELALGEDPNTYKLVRKNGIDAKSTLSEGEKSFLTFLYFYHLLKGSHSETGVTNDKIVVIDDPVSSLDNDVLFIVSTLIRELVQDVYEDKNSIKQLFIFTHNIYFHKEVTFNIQRRKKSIDMEKFWIINKNDKSSSIEKKDENPIKTSYELLWDAVRENTTNNSNIQNTLRRILENYFKLIGHINLNELYNQFEGDDKIKCKALCSWVHDGSHSVFDEDFYTPLDDVMIRKFLDIFQQIFQKTGHISHYNLMIGIGNEAEV